MYYMNNFQDYESDSSPEIIYGSPFTNDPPELDRTPQVSNRIVTASPEYKSDIQGESIQQATPDPAPSSMDTNHDPPADDDSSLSEPSLFTQHNNSTEFVFR